MLDSMIRLLGQSDGARRLRNGLRGLERETLRVNTDGQLSMTPHAEALGSALTHPYLTTDYSEALLEFVTPPRTDNQQVLEFLLELHRFVHKTLDTELLWPSSMPCIINADEAVPIAQYGSSNEGRFRSVYRSGLGFRYGRAMQAIAGTHFNYSLPDEFWPAFRDACNSDEDLTGFKSSRLMGLVRNYRRIAWLVAYLFGASPAFCKSFRPDGHPRLESLDSNTWHAPYGTSLRMSDLGYRNTTQSRLRISANSLAEFLRELDEAVTTPDPNYEAIGVCVDGEYRQLNANILQIENEYYSSIRPKPSNRDLRPRIALARDGIEYVEVRTLDLNPALPLGVGEREMRLLEVLLIYCLLAESPPISEAEQDEIDARELSVAWEGRRPGLELSRGGRPVSLGEWGLEIVGELEKVAELLDSNRSDYAGAVAEARAVVERPAATPSAQLLAELRDQRVSFFEYSLHLAEAHRAYFQELNPAHSLQKELAAAAEQSLHELAALEAAPELPFDEFLKFYLGSR